MIRQRKKKKDRAGKKERRLHHRQRAPAGRSDRPAMGIVTSAAAPYTINASAARPGEIPSVLVRYSTRNASTIVPARFTSVAAHNIQISLWQILQPAPGVHGVAPASRRQFFRVPALRRRITRSEMSIALARTSSCSKGVIGRPHQRPGFHVLEAHLLAQRA